MEKKAERISVKKIKSISEYIQCIDEMSNGEENFQYVYRGETQWYPTSCVPNLFRNKHREQKRFEKSLLDKVRSEGFDREETYILTAIEAQHGGFPSRFLDVSFNSLIALFFATTPHYTEEIESKDNHDGIVTVIQISEKATASSQEIANFYEEVILNDNKFNSIPISSYNHICIDYYSKNERIKAQQGGFILFPGKEYRPISETKKKVVVIDKNYKNRIREDLQKYFGYSNAFVYPEPNNFAKNIDCHIPHFMQELNFSYDKFVEKFILYSNDEVESRLSLIINMRNNMKESYSNDGFQRYSKILEEVLSLEKYICNLLIDSSVSDAQYNANGKEDYFPNNTSYNANLKNDHEKIITILKNELDWKIRVFNSKFKNIKKFPIQITEVDKLIELSKNYEGWK